MRKVILFLLITNIFYNCGRNQPDNYYEMREMVHYNFLREWQKMIREIDKKTLLELFPKDIVKMFLQARVFIKGMDKTLNNLSANKSNVKKTQIYLKYREALIKKAKHFGVSIEKLRSLDSDKALNYLLNDKFSRPLYDVIRTKIYHITNIALKDLLGDNIHILKKHLHKKGKYEPYYSIHKQKNNIELSVGLLYLNSKQQPKVDRAECENCWLEVEEGKIVLKITGKKLGVQGVPITLWVGDKIVFLKKEINVK